VLELARNHSNKYLTTKTVAAKQDIPPPFLTKVLSPLIKGGIITSHRGAGGGIRLAKPPEKITLKEVIEIVEGHFFLNQCLSEAGNCTRKPHCKVHQIWIRAQNALLRELDVTLDKLI
jgi:Rrf2 family protein